MAISIDNPISSRDEGKGHVFGTFPDGSVYYDTSEFERMRSDGTTIIDIVPDCRVFIYGGEVSKDVISVNIQNSLGGNTCSIKLANPRGKYEISKSDLIGNWREDKDILSTYGYDWLKRLTPDTPDILGLFVSQNTKSVIDTLTDPHSQEWWSRRAGNVSWPSVFNVTRMMFELKHFSGITKRSGDAIFDYRDPVMVFMKGRFSPYWYFAFTGIVASWSDTDTYDQEQTISLQCEDPLCFLKRTRFTKQGSLLNFGNLETMTRNLGKGQAFNIWQTLFGGTKDGQKTSLDRAVKFILYGTDKGGKVVNCHPRFSTRSGYSPNEFNIEGMRKKLSEDFKIGKPGGGGYVQWQDESDFMFTFTENDDYSLTGYQGYSNNEDAAQRWTSLIETSDIAKIQNGSLNEGRPLADATALYLQYNGIEIEEFTGANLTKFYNESVRYWEVRPTILENSPGKDFSGWGEGRCIGIAGTHPALTHNFINYFEALPHVWKECWNKRSTNKNILDKLVVSPHEKIRELVSGNPTEDATLDSGNHINLFRPRAFLVLPRKFLDKNRSVVETGFGNLQLFKAEQARAYDCLKEICSAVEFNVFSSPAGDIFIEPEMYDFHPIEFVLRKDPKSENDLTLTQGGQIESRNIVLKKEEVEFRTVNSDEFGEGGQRRKDNAYFFNPDANHPFFLMEKDRIRCTQDFKPENIVTHVGVMGSPTGGGGVGDAVLLGLSQAIGRIQGQSGSQEASQIGEKYYIADGFGSPIRRGIVLGKDGSALNLLIKKLRKDFYNNVYQKIILTHLNATLDTLFNDAGEAALKLAKEEYDLRDFPLDTGLWSLLPLLRYLEEKGEIENTAVLTNNEPPYTTTEAVYATATVLCPSIVSYLQEYVDARRKVAFKSNYKSVWDRLIEITPYSQIKQFIFTSKENSVVAALYDLSANYDDNVVSGLDRTRIDIKRGLIQLYLPLALQDAELRSDYEYIQGLEAKKGNKIEAIDVMTLSDLKALEEMGLYNPSADMVRYYGYNPSPTIKNMMIYNDGEAVRYARTWFNKLIGKVHQIHMDIIGRPEMMLNRPYYCERKDAIGLLQNFSIQYAIDSDFQTSLDLTYIRKNSLTYDYTMDKLDEICGVRTNKDFKDAAVAYYNSLADRLNLTQKGLSGIGRAAGKAIGGEIGSEIGQQLLNYEGQGYAGALFTAHNWLGHMEFDRMGREDPVRSGGVKKDDVTDPKHKIFLGRLDKKETLASAVLVRYMMAIKTYLNELDTIENRLWLLKEEIDADQDTKDLDEELKQGVRQSNQVKLQAHIVSKLYTVIKLKDQHKYLCRHIYGYGEYVGGTGEEVRKPTKTDLHNAYNYYYKNNVDKDSLYYRFVDEIILKLGISLKKIKLLDDRTVGVVPKKEYVIKTGNDATLPLYMAPVDGSDWTTIFEE